MGRHLSENLINTQYLTNKNRFPSSFKVEYVYLSTFSDKYRAQLDEMKPYFGWVPHKEPFEMVLDGIKQIVVFHQKYNKDLFYIGPFYYLEFPPELKALIAVDIDLEIKTDMMELWKHHENMQKSEILALGPELKRYYWRRTEGFRERNPGTNVGLPGPRNQGLNSGVAIYHLEHWRANAADLEKIMKEEYYAYLTKKYFTGGLGDQDLFTMLGWERPDLFYMLPCQFNVQVFVDIDKSEESKEKDEFVKDPEYRNCRETPKIYHINGLIGTE